MPEPIIRLLASSVATVLKATRVAGMSDSSLLPFSFVNIPELRQPLTGALTAAISLLLPRMAGASGLQGASQSTLVNAARAVGSMMILSQWRRPEHCPLMVLGSCHAATLVSRASEELLHCSAPTTTRSDAHYAVGMMARYTAFMSR